MITNFKFITLLRFLGVSLLSFMLFWPPAPLHAATLAGDRIPLTVGRFEQQLNNPATIDGVSVIDLRHFIIDLRPENQAFRNRFYQRLQTQLTKAGTPLGLDLSDSLIKGEFTGHDLGLRTPLYGQSLSPLLTDTEREQLRQDRRFLLENTTSITANPRSSAITLFRGVMKFVNTDFTDLVDFSNSFFLKSVNAEAASFSSNANFANTHWSQPANFTNTKFQAATDFQRSTFLAKTNFHQSRFLGVTTFQNSEFKDITNFSQTRFQQLANFRNSQWENTTDFSESHWQDRADFSKSQFNQMLLFNQAVWEKSLTFRQSKFQKLVNFQGVSLQGTVDFSDTAFVKNAILNVPELSFDSSQAKLMGDIGEIGRVISVPALEGNENVLRNLVRNFRFQEQIPDANQIEYLRASLQLQGIKNRLVSVNINTASERQLVNLGFSPEQTEIITQARGKQPFHQLTELLNLEGIDLGTYLKVYHAMIADIPDGSPALTWLTPIAWLSNGFLWFWLSLLLLLSGYGTQFWLVFGVGLITIAYFGVLYWWVDRYRRRLPAPIIPTLSETVWMITSFSVLLTLGLIAVFGVARYPWLTLAGLGTVIIPAPLILLTRLYWQGRYHDLLKVSYFTEEGSLRQLRLMIGRLPIMPRYQLFRERYMPILWDRHWNWLNYYDFSLNNFLKFGFNDIRLRDEHLPGLITTLVWYQWVLGIFYLTLLLWTLSRTIPGLNLLIYLK